MTRPLSDRDAEIRKLVPFVMRATKCKREVAIQFLCALGEDRRDVVRGLRILETLNKKGNRRKLHIEPLVNLVPDFSEGAWSKPR